ncbi:2-dehydropantoate 2-reductase [Actinacidiphila yanglinensis]|uniref:2-dehydropantoate 2-reductase n=1 Tax=Actinacidiphila yanglinensis TaxID=310779 RepID=A0A1H5XU75_9ACTN|nr:2-dehydropantoate 2-reductase [Actinacidiphila yanglinensis]SEG15271.1 2-dehydropantoate 2-reductase [Actinacidiphila yanglinensis]
MNHSPRVLVVGAGGTGGYYGGRLLQAGLPVTFLLRPARASAIRQNGLRLVTPSETSLLTPEVITAAELDSPFDVVILATRADAIDAVTAQIAPAVGESTRILPLLNGVDHLAVLTDKYGEDRVLGAVAMIAAAQQPDGSIHQLTSMAGLTVGSPTGQPVPDAVHRLDVPGISFTLSEEILADMWQKWAFIVSTTSLTTLMSAPVGEAIATPDGLGIARAIAAEAASVAAAAGHPLGAKRLQSITGTLTQEGSPATTSVFRDMTAGRPVEVEPMLGAFLNYAAAHGVDVPRIQLATARLRVYQNRLATL